MEAAVVVGVVAAVVLVDIVEAAVDLVVADHQGVGK